MIKRFADDHSDVEVTIVRERSTTENMLEPPLTVNNAAPSIPDPLPEQALPPGGRGHCPLYHNQCGKLDAFASTLSDREREDYRKAHEMHGVRRIFYP